MITHYFNIAAFFRIMLLYLLLAGAWVGLARFGLAYEMPDAQLATFAGLTLAASTAIHFGLRDQPLWKWIVLSLGLLLLQGCSVLVQQACMALFPGTVRPSGIALLHACITGPGAVLLLYKLYQLRYFWLTAALTVLVSMLVYNLFRQNGLAWVSLTGLPIRAVVPALFIGIRLIPVALGVTIQTGVSTHNQLS
jgi:hypothetical protein